MTGSLVTMVTMCAKSKHSTDHLVDNSLPVTMVTIASLVTMVTIASLVTMVTIASLVTMVTIASLAMGGGFF